jgi:hypothetical protein
LPWKGMANRWKESSQRMRMFCRGLVTTDIFGCTEVSSYDPFPATKWTHFCKLKMRILQDSWSEYLEPGCKTAA